MAAQVSSLFIIMTTARVIAGVSIVGKYSNIIQMYYFLVAYFYSLHQYEIFASQNVSRGDSVMLYKVNYNSLMWLRS